MMSRVLMDKSRYRPEPEDRIVKAFQVLDKENKGFLTQEELQRYMTTEGEEREREGQGGGGGKRDRESGEGREKNCCFLLLKYPVHVVTAFIFSSFSLST